ncbi:MAG: hypothetical protein KAI79_03210 [Bacteroidales bacterium]|nr:hypothetical protein [Bacteroidales bacterium]
MKNSKIVFLVLLSIFFWQCKTNDSAEKFSVTPPFPDFNPEYTVFTQNAQDADTFVYSTGTQLFVPSNIWTDSVGNIITGEINLKYREFHRAEEVFLAGAHLNYDSTNINGSLTTAGMFEIRAYQNGKVLQIKDSSTIDVKMASYNSKTNYNFYAMDDNSGVWNYKGNAEPEINTEIKVIKENITKLESKDAFPLNKKTSFVLNYDAALDVMFNNNYNAINKNRNSKKIKRKIESYGALMTKVYGGRWTELKYRGMKFFVWEMLWKTMNNQRIPYWVKTKESRVYELKYLGNNNYLMKLDDYGDKKVNLYVKAVMPLKVLFAVPPNARKEEYEKVLEEIRVEKERLAMQAKVYRSFKVSSPGYHNWDMVYHRSKVIAAKANFKFDIELDKDAVPQVFYFLDSNKTFVYIQNWQNDSIMMTPDSTAKYIAVLSQNKAAIFNASKYQALNFDEIEKTGIIEIPLTSFDINSPEDIMKIMN